MQNTGDFDEEAALRILERIREGATLTEAASKEEHLTRRGVVEWLFDSNCKIGKDSFLSLHKSAAKRRAVILGDEHVRRIKNFHAKDRSVDGINLRKLEMLRKAQEGLWDGGDKRGDEGEYQVVIKQWKVEEE